MSERKKAAAGALDPRARRTRRAIVEAFVACAAEKGLEAAGVAEACRRAGINRATFYRHFEDKDDLVERGLDLILEEAAAAVEAADDPSAPFEERVSRRAAVFFERVRSSESLFRALVSGPARGVFADKLENLIAAFFADRRLPRLAGTGSPGGLASRALAAALLAHVAWWLEEAGEEGPEEMGRLFIRFALSGLSPGPASGQVS
jgi:AcrR family transcriptional regulator